MSAQTIELAAAKLKLDMISSDRLPKIAVDALVDGLDSPSLQMLAGLTPCETDEANELFVRTLIELNVDQPTNEDAVEQVCREIAESIMNGRVSPYEGAKQISQLSVKLEKHNHKYDTFIYGESEWEDRPEDRPLFERGIIAAAKDLTTQ